MDFLNSVERSKLAVAGLVLAAVLFLAINIFSNATFRSVQADLTEGGLYTISDGTRNVLQSIEEPITIRLYFSKLLGERSPLHATYFTRVRELLKRYAAIAEGMVKIELHNPEPFSESEDRAVQFGLRGVPVTATGDLGYFGLAATNSTDDEEIIRFFSPEREPFVEYDLTRLIHKLANPKTVTVGVLSALPLEGVYSGRRPSRRWIVMDQVRDFFDVRKLAPDLETIPEDVDLLMIAHPRELSDRAIYAIDQFVLGGGRALVFVDPLSETGVARAGPLLASGASEFDRMLDAWGISMVKDKVAANLDAARRVSTASGPAKTMVIDYVVWLSMTSANFNRDDVVTTDLSVVNLATAGILEPVEGHTTEITPLIITSPNSMRVDVIQVQLRPDPVRLFREFESSDEALTLAVRMRGPAKSAFPDGPPPAEEMEGAEKAETAKTAAKEETAAEPAAAVEHLAESREPINVIVVADSDMLHDTFWVESRDFLGRRLLVPYANNADFVVNALDNLTGSDSLIGLRARGKSRRPFHLVEDLRQDAERRFRAKEQTLLAKLDEVKAKLEELTRQAGAGSVILNMDEKTDIETYRVQMVKTRRELRDVQHALRQDIERLGAWLKFVNIAAIPIVLVIASIIVTVVRRRRHAHYVRTA